MDIRELARGLAGWALPIVERAPTTAGDTAPPEEERREWVASMLEWAPLLPRSVVGELAGSLRALNGGQINPLLQPSKSTRRGPARYDKTRAELRLLCWISWQVGRGRKQYEAEEEVRETCCISKANFGQWRHKVLPRHLPTAVINSNLAVARGIGEEQRELEARGLEPDGINSVPGFDTEQPNYWAQKVGIWCGQRGWNSLPTLAENYKRATGRKT